MPAHIKRRKDRGSTYYLVDGSRIESLKTTKKGLAEHLLKEYIKGKYGLEPTPTVQDYFDKWIEKKIEPLFRRAQVRDYRQHFQAYILPKFKAVCIFRRKSAPIPLANRHSFRWKSALVPTQIGTPF
jgi:hypothetical protein